MPCGWEGNRRSGVALVTCQTLVVLHLRAQGLEEGDEHPPMLSCEAWLTLPLCTQKTKKLCMKVSCDQQLTTLSKKLC